MRQQGTVRAGGAWRSDSGASAVEFALVMPFLLVLVFGMLSGGLALNQKLGVEQANREAARWAATLPLESCGAPVGVPAVPADCWFADVATNAVIAANGELDEGVPGREICVAFVHEDALGIHSRALTWSSVSGPLTVSNATAVGTSCWTDGLDPKSPHVQVLVRRMGRFDAIFYGSDLTLESRSVARFEPALPYASG